MEAPTVRAMEDTAGSREDSFISKTSATPNGSASATPNGSTSVTPNGSFGTLSIDGQQAPNDTLGQSKRLRPGGDRAASFKRVALPVVRPMPLSALAARAASCLLMSKQHVAVVESSTCLLYTSPSPRDS